MNRPPPPAPVLNGPATLSYGSDRNPGTVIGITGNIITVQEDHYKVVSGGEHDGSAAYEYAPNPLGGLYHFRMDRKGRYQPVRRNPATGRWNQLGFGGAYFGDRQRYYDPHF